MKGRNLVILCVLTAIVIIAAIFSTQQKAPQTVRQKEILFPGLTDKINDLAEISLQKNDHTLTLLKHDDLWIIKEADNYPALFEKIRLTGIAVADFRVIAEKTKNPEMYNRLGVEDPGSGHASSILLTLKDNAQQTLAEIIVGKTRLSKAASDNPGLYVRRPDDDTALLVEGKLDISDNVSDWFDRNLFDIDSDRIKSIKIDHDNESSIQLSRENGQDDFIIENLPPGKEPQSEVIINRPATVLENFFVDGVKAENKLEYTGPVTTTTFSAFDGLAATIVSFKKDDVNYARFSFTFTAPAVDTDKPTETDANETNGDKPKKPDVKKEVQDLNETLTGWIYEIPEFKYELLTKKPADLIKEPDSGEGTKAESE